MHANKYESSLNKDPTNIFDGKNFFSVLYLAFEKTKKQKRVNKNTMGVKHEES